MRQSIRLNLEIQFRDQRTPENPTFPVDPENPTFPVDPENPTSPVDPENPTSPVDPENPTFSGNLKEDHCSGRDPFLFLV